MFGVLLEERQILHIFVEESPLGEGDIIFSDSNAQAWLLL